MSRRFALVLDNVNMGLGHDGLTALAMKLGIDPSKLQAAELILYINRAKDKIKILGKEGKVLGYLRFPKGKRISTEAIQFIPQTFSDSGEINYDAALKEALGKILGGESKTASPLQIYRRMKSSGLKK